MNAPEQQRSPRCLTLKETRNDRIPSTKAGRVPARAGGLRDRPRAVRLAERRDRARATCRSASPARPPQTRTIEQGLAARGEAFDVHRYADEAAAREAIEDREVYGAFVATPGGPKALTASAASVPVTALLTHARGREPTRPWRTSCPPPRARGALPSSVLPLVIGGILIGVASIALATSPLQRAGFVLGGALLTGLTAAVLVQGWLDVIGGDWAANAAVLA